MRNLCFGGSFNPIHKGHLATSEAVARQVGFERVLLIPSATSPHKLGHADMAAATDRLAMCKLAAAGNDLYEVSDLELTRTGPSYTIDTARALREWGWDEVNWLIGADQVPALPRWHEPAALLREVNFLIMARPGWSFDWNTLPPEFHVLQDRVVQAPRIDISATDIRRRIRHGHPIDHLMPAAVADYIRDHKLYA
ncbi:MAG: nicotinate (nicotinamide) nucleotide adenylyltransferase [Tepidisphaeraceae bacterium]